MKNMKNLKQFEDFINEGFLSKSKNVNITETHEDDDIAEKILNYIKENPNKIRRDDKNNNLYTFYWKNSVITITFLIVKDYYVIVIEIDDEKLDVSYDLSNDIKNEIDKINKNIEDIKKEKEKNKKKEKLSKFRNSNFDNNEA